MERSKQCAGMASRIVFTSGYGVLWAVAIMTGAGAAAVLVAVVVAMMKAGREGRGVGEGRPADFCRFSVEAVKYPLGDTQPRNLAQTTRRYTFQQCSGLAVTARGR
jgi:hypothetical protein